MKHIKNGQFSNRPRTYFTTERSGQFDLGFLLGLARVHFPDERILDQIHEILPNLLPRSPDVVVNLETARQPGAPPVSRTPAVNISFLVLGNFLPLLFRVKKFNVNLHRKVKEFRQIVPCEILKFAIFDFRRVVCCCLWIQVHFMLQHTTRRHAIEQMKQFRNVSRDKCRVAYRKEGRKQKGTRICGSTSNT